MAVDARRLSATAAQRRSVDSVIQEQIRIVEAKLESSPKNWGENRVIVELATLFDFPGLDRKTAQTIVYATIIREFNGRDGLTANICFVTQPRNRTFLIVKWTNNISPQELDAFTRIIKSAVVPPSTLAPPREPAEKD